MCWNWGATVWNSAVAVDPGCAGARTRRPRRRRRNRGPRRSRRYSALSKAGGPSSGKWVGDGISSGSTNPSHVPTIGTKPGGVGRHSPGASGSSCGWGTAALMPSSARRAISAPGGCCHRNGASCAPCRRRSEPRPMPPRNQQSTAARRVREVMAQHLVRGGCRRPPPATHGHAPAANPPARTRPSMATDCVIHPPAP